MHYNYRMDLKLIQLLLQNCKITPEKPLVVGVSGGADSLCLLDILQRLGYSVVAAHFNHQIRENADLDEQILQTTCCQKSIPFVSGRAKVPQIAVRERLSLEEAARKLRYRFLFTEARKFGAQAVAVAHNSDDQVETILMHFLRGSGLAGLRGMQVCTILSEWDPFIPLIRPLLETDRCEIDQYCVERNLHPSEDETNLDVRYLRNRLRHELIPELETYNSDFRIGLRRMANVLAGEESLLEDVTQKAWQECCQQVDASIIQVHPRIFIKYPRPTQRRLLRYAVNQLLPDLRDLDFNSIERCLNFLENSPHKGSVDVVDDIRLMADQDAWFLLMGEVIPPTAGFPQVMNDQEIILPVNGEVALGSGWYVRTEEIKQPIEICHRNKNKIWLDVEVWEAQPVIRQWRPAERFFPLGLNGHSMKISDLMTNQHIPRRARPGWPVLATKLGVCWVVGVKAGDLGKISPQTNRVICVELFRR